MKHKKKPERKLPTCKGCKNLLDRVIVESKCTQTLSVESNDYSDTEVHESVGGYCKECGRKISPKVLKELENWATDRICA